MDRLITMEKDGETIDVSPLTVKAHEEIGWKVAEGKSPAAEAQPPAEPPSKEKTRRGKADKK